MKNCLFFCPQQGDNTRRERKREKKIYMSSGDASSSSSSVSSLKAVIAISFSVGVITGFVLNSKLRKLL
jgi:hypothetical protein